MVLEIVKPGWMDGEDFPIFSVDIHPSGVKFATGGQGNDCGRIIIWNMEPIRNEKAQKDAKVPKQLCQMENHLACVNAVRWSGDGKYLASAGDDKLVMLWTKSNYGGGAVFGGGGKVNHENYRCSSTLRQHGGDVLDLSWSPDDRYLASCSVDNTVIVWDVTGSHPQSVSVLRGHSSHVKGVTWDPVGKYLASQGADKAVRIWRTSDWKEESVVKEPFQECGGTTHVLRLNWSPDGQYLVTAHAMNSGGPTAQIIDRDGFKYENDFVGHRKAVTCVRFNGNIFQSQSSSSAKKDNYVCVAIGSRDRSISVWLTCLKRPLVVINDLFDSTVMDLAWSKDGMTLIACSHDGRIAGLNFSQADLGTPVTQTEKSQLFKKLYGQASGITLSDRPVLIENAELLNLNDNIEDMFDFTESNNTTTNTTMNGTPIKGPTDKQIEVKTSDGRRRITPMFIVPSADNGDMSALSRNSSDSMASKLYSSSSTETKSKIRIERRDVVVKPNVSPGKNNSNSNSNGADVNLSKQFPAKKDEGPKPNMIQIKRKVGTTIVPVSQPTLTASSTAAKSGPEDAKSPSTKNSKSATTKPPGPGVKSAVNGIKSGADKVDDKPAKKSDKSKEKEKEKEKDDEKIKGKKPATRIESSSDSSESDSDSSDSDSSDSDSSDETTASQTEKSGKSDGEEIKVKTNKLKANLIGTKRKAEDSPQNITKKKRLGRPPLSASAGNTTSGKQSAEVASAAPIEKVVSVATDAVSSSTAAPGNGPPRHLASPLRIPGLPPLAIPSNPFYSLLKTANAVLHVTVKNEYASYSGGSLHRVSAHTSQDPASPLLWEALFTSPVAGCISGSKLIVIALRDATLHMYRPDGSRALAPLTLPSPVHKLKDEGSLVACITNSARIFVFNTDSDPPTAVVKNVEITPLNRHTSPRTSISITSLQLSSRQMPLLTLSDGSTHVYSDNLGCWVQLVPSRHALSLSATLNKGPPPSLPLASLSPSPTGMTKLEAGVAESWTCSVIETKLAACVVLKSPQEYKYWLLRLIKQLTSLGQETRLRGLLQDLAKEKCTSSSLATAAQSLGLDRKELLKASLPILGTNLSLQRLYSQLRNEEELKSSGNMDLFA